MGIWKCEDCGTIFREDEMGYYEECVGEFWGAPAYERFCVCPKCGSDYIEEVEDSDVEDYTIYEKAEDDYDYDEEEYFKSLMNWNVEADLIWESIWEDYVNEDNE